MVTHEGRVIYKVNQDRGLISHPSLNRAKHTVFGVFDGEYFVAVVVEVGVYVVVRGTLSTPLGRTEKSELRVITT